MRITTSIIILLGIPFAWWSLRDTSSVPLLPCKVYFCQSKKYLPSISPDGNFIAYLAPVNETIKDMNLWVRSVATDDPYLLTSSDKGSIKQFQWAKDSNTILYLTDMNGNENWRLYGVDKDTKEITCYTPFDRVQARLIKHPISNKVLLALNKNNRAIHDIYSLDLPTKELTLIINNPGHVSQWAADAQGTIRAAMEETEDGGKNLLLRKETAKETNWEVIRTYDVEESRSCRIVSIAENNIYLLENKDTDTLRLVIYHIDSKDVEVIAQDEAYDIARVQVDQDSQEVEAVLIDRIKPEWKILKSGLSERILAACSHFDGIIHFTPTSPRAIVCFEKDTVTPTYYLYDDSTHELTELFRTHPDVTHLVPMKPITFQSRDGLTLSGYVTAHDTNPRPMVPRPMVLMVHGGPWARDSWGYIPEVQWLVNRGYAVLQINYRGSQGLGKAFMNAGNKEWGGKMQDDLIDGVQWAIKQGIADPQKIAIYGASYGGYAVLVAATNTPDLFCCAIDSMGISNLLTLFASIPPYWKIYRQWLYKTIGNPETEAALLRERSPLFKAAQIKIPLLIVQGAHDPRVPITEAEQIVAALKERNIDHDYMLFSGEGHALCDEHNRLLFYQQAEKFLQQHLGGRCEPVDIMN